MTVFVLIREDQNEHGYVDTSIVGVFSDKRAASELDERERQLARGQGLLVEADDSPDGEWQVSWAIEEHIVT